jgi:hypothetical protein
MAIETGAIQPSSNEIDAIARALRVTPSLLSAHRGDT